ncbi:MAG TPA: adenosylmethionine decarboxylase [Clostridiaceae bacterium]|nr:adenosylmethionine decarboxylase [Clostridiaceae bacterium]
MARNEMGKIKLHGFNNLTKTLSFNMYDICYTKTVFDRNAYIEYIDERYNAERLTRILTRVTEIIGANILNIASQDYDPQGASVTLLICEEPINQSVNNEQKDSHKTKNYIDDKDINNNAIISENNDEDKDINVVKNTGKNSLVAHLDKSHITVHTYPEYHPDGGVCTFRADIDVSTCGKISPLNALNYLIDCFEPDIMTIDYRVRGFTRDITGRKIFNDHKLSSIQNYISSSVIARYHMIDVNIYQENIFHTKCKLREFDLDNYLFGFSEKDIHPGEAKEIARRLRKEMDEIFYGHNFSDDY